MSNIRRNTHINKCYEGKGKIDIMEYNEERKIKLFMNYSKQKYDKLINCPICGKDIQKNKIKDKKGHIYKCSKLSLR